MNLRPVKLAVFSTHPIQYQVPLWRSLANTAGLDVRVYYGCDAGAQPYHDPEFNRTVAWNVPLLDGYRYTLLEANMRDRRIGPRWPGTPGLLWHLLRDRPDVALLTAYGARFHLETMALLRLLGVPAILRHEADDPQTPRPGLRAKSRDTLLRALYLQVAGFGVIGKNASRHLTRLGVPSRRRVPAPYAADVSSPDAHPVAGERDRAHARSTWQVAPDEVVVLFVGKLIPKKDPLVVLEALKMLPASLRTRVHAVFAGDGEERAKLEQAGREILGARFQCLGFMNQRELGAIYAAADLLVLPSRRDSGETWGLVVNEAFHHGLPAIVSDGVGCRDDLIREGITGGVFPAGNTDALARALAAWAARLPTERSEIAHATRDLVSRYSIETARAGLAALAFAVASDGAPSCPI